MIPPTATMSHIHHLFASMISHIEKLCYMTSNTNIKLYSERMTCITQNLILKQTIIVECKNNIK